MASRSKKYYDKNPKSKKRKLEYDSEYQDNDKRRAYKRELERKRRKAAKRGMKIEGLDYDHATRRFIPQSLNRAKK
tara:strand:+ start:146 stop:373 length:228 start_codon:yes stop_codon:yes gene_type:complete